MTRAFSIVELVIAIALLGLVAALALPAGVALLTNEGGRSGLFVCEGAVRAVRDTAMREAVILEIGATEDEGSWTLVARPMESADDPPAWETVATLPDGFAFRFEPMPTLADSLDRTPAPPVAFSAAENEPERVAVVLPSGAVEGVGTWRLVTEQPGNDRVDLLSIAKWTGAITPRRETQSNSLLGERDPTPPAEPTP
ncbi:MAG: hypothetical protein AAGH64_05285 [Planctomycetota bacterium]